MLPERGIPRPETGTVFYKNRACGVNHWRNKGYCNGEILAPKLGHTERIRHFKTFISKTRTRLFYN